MMFHRLRVSTKSTTLFLQTLKQTVPNSIFTKHLHTSNQPTLKRADLHYAFDCITNIDEAVALFHYMLQMKPQPPLRYYNNLFKSLVKIEHESHVVKIEHYSQVVYMFKKMSFLGFPVDEYTMCTVINCYAHLKEVELGFAVIGGFVKRGYFPDIVVFNCIIKGFFLKGEVAKAVDIFRSLIKGKLCEVDEVTLLSVLDGLSKSGNVGDAVELLQLAEKNSWKVDVKGYNAVVDGLCKGRNVKDGLDLLLRMVDMDVYPNVVTYNCLLHGLCMNGRLEFACSVFNDLHSKGICPNVITYTVIIQGYCLKGLFRDAKEMLEKMERAGCVPDNFTYNIIIQGCLYHLNSLDSINLIKHIVGVDFHLCASTFFLLLPRMQVLRQMHGIYDDDVIDHLIRKLISSCSIHAMRDKDDEFMISSLIDKLNSSDCECECSI